MKRHYIHIISFLLLLLSGGLAFGQGSSKSAAGVKADEQAIIPAQYVFFHGDSLDGMDLNSLFNDMGRYHAVVHLSEWEKHRYMYFRQKEFVRVKYHLPGRKFEDPAASPDLQTDRKIITVKNKPFVLTGNGTTFRQGGGGANPTTLNNPCNDVDFENSVTLGTGWPANWTGDVIWATPGFLQGTPQGVGFYGSENAAIADAVASNAGNVCSYHTLVTAAAGNDPYGATPMNMPYNSSAFSYRLGGPYVNLGGDGLANNTYFNICNYTQAGPGSPYGFGAAGEIVQQTITVTAGVNDLLTYYYNVFLADGGHPSMEQPYFNAQVLNNAGDIIGCSVYTQECTVGVPPAGYNTSATQWGPFAADGPQIATNVYYSGWQSNIFDLSPYAGQTVTLQFMTAGCAPGGHMGYAYVDGSCGPKLLAIAAPPYCGGLNYQIQAPKVPSGSLFSWSGIGIVGSTTSSFITVNNSPGATTTYTYAVTITPPPPNNGGTCQFTVSGKMTYAPALTSSSTSVTNITCNGLTNGKATASNSGGTAPFTYSWSPGGQVTQTATGLGVQSYTVTVTDANACSSTTVAPIRQPEAVSVEASPTNPLSTCGTGTVTATPSGGTPNYTFSWAPAGAAAQTYTTAAAGAYTVTVTDANGCTSTSTTTIVQPAGEASTWLTTGTTNWFTATNWSSGCVPNCASDVNIPSGGTQPTINAAGAQCRTFNLVSGATLTFASGGVLSVCGDFIQAGTINTNNGVNGTIQFTGSVPQNFTSSGQGVNFFNVVLNNTAAIPPNLIIKEGNGYKDLIVSSTGSFTFTNGIIYTEGGKNLVLRNSATPGDFSGYGATKYVNGRIRRYVAIGSYDFPVGNTPISGNVYPYELMNVVFTAMGTPALDSITVSFSNPANYTGTGGPWTEPGTNVYNGLSIPYTSGASLADIGGTTTSSGAGSGGLWTVMPGPATAGTTTEYTYNLTLTGTNWANNGATNFAHTIIKRSPFQNGCANGWGLNGNYVDPGGNESSVIAGVAITTKRSGMSGFSQLGQIQASPGHVLPIELLMFDASCTSNNVVINWATATETNNRLFTLDRSCNENPFQWQTVATIEGAGNSSILKSYSYTDKDLTAGECYYRLSQTDNDGVNTAFPLISINCKPNANFNLIGVVPNPGVDQLNVLFSTSTTDIIHISMMDMLGQQAMEKDISPENGLNTVELDISSLNTGVYFVKVNNGTNEFVKKIVKR